MAARCSNDLATRRKIDAATAGLPIVAGRALGPWGAAIYGASVRAASAKARKQADSLACEAWNKRMLAFQGPAQPSPTLGDALNAGVRL